MKTRFALILSPLLLLALPGRHCPVMAETQPDAPPVEKAVMIRWYGQSFVILQNSNGMRVAIDPFDNKKSAYPIPENEAVDIVLVSNEDSDHNNTDIFANSPMCFRSATGRGKNNGNGIIFKGIVSFQDNERGRYKGDSNIYVFELDGIRFAHLGALGQSRLTNQQLSEIGPVDVVFVPVGLCDLGKVVSQIKPRLVIPLHFKTPFTKTPLYPLDDFIKDRTVRYYDSDEIRIPANGLPSKQEVWVPTLAPVKKK